MIVIKTSKSTGEDGSVAARTEACPFRADCQTTIGVVSTACRVERCHFPYWAN